MTESGEPIKTVQLTIDTVVFTGKGWYWGARHRNSTAALSTVYDGVDANGAVIDEFRAVANSERGHMFRRPVRVDTGLFVDVTGSPAVQVWYQT